MTSTEQDARYAYADAGSKEEWDVVVVEDSSIVPKRQPDVLLDSV